MRQIPLSRRVANLEESATLALNARVKQLQAQGRPVFNFTAGELDGPTPEFIRRAVSTRLTENKYTPTAGLGNLRDQIAKYESRRLGVKLTAANIVVTAGAKTALYALLQVLIDRSDEVILPTPAWVSYAHMIELAGGKVVKVPLTETNDLDPKVLRSRINPKTKAILINSPNNPTGAVFSDASFKKFAADIKGKPVVVISDDIYSTLSYDRPFKPLTKFGLTLDQLVVVNGLSKSQALTGWRIGYIAANQKLAEVLNGFLSHATGNAPLPAQIAAEAAMARGNQPTMYKTLMKRRNYVAAQLQKIPQIKFQMPGGAFYFWLDVRGLSKNSVKWCEQLLNETGVAVVPGEAFFAPGFVRLSFAADEKVLKAGLNKLAEFINNNSN